MISKKIILLAGLAVTLLFSQAALAHSGKNLRKGALAVNWGNKQPAAAENVQENKEKFQAATCENIVDQANQISEKIKERVSTRVQRRTDREENLDGRFAERDQKLADIRARWDKRRQEFYDKLEEKAGTDEQKQAVAEFKKAVEAAVVARRAAIDKAIADFREGLKDLIEGKKSGVDSAATQYKQSVEAAVAKAKADCDNGVSLATVQTNLRTDLQSAREKLQTARQNIEKLGPQVKALIDARQAAVKEAIEDFKTALEKARADLKEAFPQDADETGTENTD